MFNIKKKVKIIVIYFLMTEIIIIIIFLENLIRFDRLKIRFKRL